MSKLQFDPHSPLAEYFSRTKIDGEFIKNDYGDRGEFVINSETGAISLLLKCKYTWVKNSDVKDDWTFIENHCLSLMFIRQFVQNGMVKYFFLFQEVQISPGSFRGSLCHLIYR